MQKMKQLTTEEYENNQFMNHLKKKLSQKLGNWPIFISDQNKEMKIYKVNLIVNKLFLYF